ncbi:hypothetical protein FRC12_018528 [Ceratobasidium sp. 428]|nr:hypothetical protein FRC12_018528 [Ceratobasidium sp. 428]
MSQNDDPDAILELAARLQLQDIDEWRAAQKGKGRAGVLSDVEASFNMAEAEHKATIQRITDGRIARSAERAMNQDRALIESFTALEERERADRRLALTLSQNPKAEILLPGPSSAVTSAPGSLYAQSENPSLNSVRSDSVISSIAASLPADSPEGSVQSLGSYQSSNESVNVTKSVPSILILAGGRPEAECIICRDTVTRAYQAPCGCFYDRECLINLFERAAVDESLFPPRCCNLRIPFQVVRVIFTSKLIRAFERKTKEFETPNRLYCHKPRCSAFLGPAVGNQRQRSNKECTACYRRTCTFCKGVGHPPGVPCQTNADTQQVLTLGRKEGWQSCPSCHNLVELALGCYHMTCRCKHQFCYLCGQQWKSCTCPQWDESRLLIQAERRVARNQGTLPPTAGPAQVVARGVQVNQVVEALRQNHQCAHHMFGFSRQPGPGKCESCGIRIQDTILRCRGCSIQVCVRCRRNRL